MSRIDLHRILIRWGWSWLLTVCVVVGSIAAPDFDGMRAKFVQRWGNANQLRFNAWRELFALGLGGNDNERLKLVNDFFNRNIQFADDLTVWNQIDYWATPLETLGRGAGDCEDFVIAKYFTLKLLGVSPTKLRLIYVQARTGTSATTPALAHMVLAYYPSPDVEPFVLDNLISDIRVASRRTDLSPVFSFNQQGIFLGTSSTVLAPAIGSGRLSRWEDLLRRASAEGFD